MSNVWLLLKNYLRNFIGSLSKKRKSANTYAGILICIAFSALIIFIFTTNSISSTQVFLKMAEEYPGAEKMSMYTNCTLAMLMLLFITIMRSVYPSKNTDAELLLSLPIKKSSIIVAKSLYNYFFDLTIFLSILLPSYIVYFILVPNVSFGIVLRGSLFILLLPLVSNAIATYIGALCQMLARKMKHYTIFQTIISILMLCFYLVANYSVQGYLTGLSGTVDEILHNNWFIYQLLSFILDNKWLWLSLFAVICILAYALGLIFLVSRLGKLDARYENKSHILKYKKSSPLNALVKKELKQYFNIAVYLMNTIIPGILFLGLSVAVTIIGKTKALNFLNAIPAELIKDPELIIVMVFSLLLGLYVITGSSISLEGKHFWIIRANPVSAKTICTSKILANMIISVILLVCAYPFMLTFINAKFWWCYLTIPFLTSLVNVTLGLVINLMYPKMEWDKEETVVKASMASLLSLALPFFLTIIPYGIYIGVLSKYLTTLQFLGFLSLFLIIIWLILLLWLNNKAEKALFKASNN